MQHRVQNDLETADFQSSARMMESPEGYVLGFGTTVGNGLQGWAPGAIFVDTDAAQGSQVMVNTGTKTTATWTEIADAGVAGGFTMDDAANIAVNATTGTKIGTATSQKLGFFNATPVVQTASAAGAVAATPTAATASGAVQGFATLSNASVFFKSMSNVIVRQAAFAKTLSDLGFSA